LATAAAREVKEEVNVDFIPSQKFWFYETTTEEYRIIGFVYLGEWKWEIKALDSEISDIGRFTYEETTTLAIAFSYRETIEDLHNRWLLD
jgi:ADP-ribose pyrophosphatase YjhB (NUDIX family)